MNKITFGLLTSALALTFPVASHAVTYTWDISTPAVVVGGSGTWDQVTSNWTTTAGVTNTTWVNSTGSDAVFIGIGGTVSLSGTILAGNVSFGNGYTLAGSGSLLLSDGGSFNTGDFTLNGAVTNANTVWNITGGTSVFQSGANSSAFGAINLGTGRLELGAGANLSSNPTAAVALDLLSSVKLNGSGAGATLGKNINLNGGSLVVNGGDAAVFTGIFTGSGALNFNVALESAGNTLSVNRADLANTYTGATGILGNILRFTGYTTATNFNPFGTTAGAVVTVQSQVGGNAGIIFDPNNPTGAALSTTITQAFVLSANGGTTSAFELFDGTLHLSGNISLNTDVTVGSNVQFATRNSGKDLYLDGVVSGAANLVGISNVTGGTGGAVHLTNDNSFSGTYFIDSNLGAQGILSLDNNNAVKNASILVGDGIVKLNTSNATVARLSSVGATGKVVNADATARTLTVDTAVTGTFAGILGDGTTNGSRLALLKAGIGTLTLSGTNTHSQGTTVGAGLLITGNTSALGSGAVTVSGGTLRIGNGTVNSVSVAGTLSVSSGILDMSTNTTSAVSLTGAANFALSGTGVWRVNSTTGQLALGSGTFSLTGGAIDLAGFANRSVNGTYSLITGTGTSTLTNVNFINGDISKSYAINASGFLVVTAVPEPSVYGLAGAGALAAITFVRRRRRLV